MLESHLCFYTSSVFALVTFIMTMIWWMKDIEPRQVWLNVQTQYLFWTYFWFVVGLIFTAAGS